MPATPQTTTINDPFWSPRLAVNASTAINHQWNELKKSGCIDNFRIVCGEKEGFREGWVFADSDAYKWLEAAARIYASAPDPQIKTRMDALIALIAKTQMPDGYINTYNQFHFKGQRWVNLQIEHEPYCLGHLIEGCLAHHLATAETSALEIAQRAASLLSHDFQDAAPERTEGHEEIEIALLRLHQVTGDPQALQLARHFIEVRGRIPAFGDLYKTELASYEARKAQVSSSRASYAAAHPEYAVSRIPPDNEAKVPPYTRLRRRLNALSGKYNQQHAPVREQRSPEGHAVRYGYFQTATALLQRLSADASLLPALEKSWEHMLTRRMYVTGGLGSLPGNEGFGHDYELDPEYAYTETCAALASLFWNWEMALATHESKYSDLFEWQLYNAAAVGMGQTGDTYLYNNPLKVQGGITRRAWYSVPCCPSNLSRTWANLNQYIYSSTEDDLWVHPYIGSATHIADGILRLQSGLPFEGRVSLQLNLARPLTLHLRIPSWSAEVVFKLNGKTLPIDLPPLPQPRTAPAQGYDPRLSRFASLRRDWQPGDTLAIEFPMPIQLRRAHPKVQGHAGKVALTRGPLVYCLESLDNPGVDIFSTQLDPASLHAQLEPALLGGITVIKAKSTDGAALTFIPYHQWGNRGASQMNVWIDTGAEKS